VKTFWDNNDYYPYGMLIPERSWSSSEYRYGYNGKENDNEIKGIGNSLDYGARIYDSRVARFLSVDPLSITNPWNSPFTYAENDPINFIDLDGAQKGDLPYKKNNVLFVQLYSPRVSPLLRKNGETFTGTALQMNTANKIDYIVNAQQFEGNRFFYFFASNNSRFISQGFTVSQSKIITGRSSRNRFYFSMKNDEISFGKGDAPKDADFAIGGGIPLIVNGLKYGSENIYSADAPEGLPKTGDPGAENTKYLLQRSNAGFSSQDKASLGKTVIGYNSQTGALMIVSQQDGTKGMTLSQIRDYLFNLGYNNALSFDGSNSATLVKDDNVLTTPSYLKNNGIPSGIKFQIDSEAKPKK
jgi:RHS repeat-associated protein